VLGVAGTHGKTTTSFDAGLDPRRRQHGAGLPDRRRAAEFRRLGAAGRHPFFVIEADEYDTAFCDKRSKFVHYRPRTVVLNNLEFDHADIFSDLAAIETQFHHLVRTLPQSGLIVSNAAEASLERVLQRGLLDAGRALQRPGRLPGDRRRCRGELTLHGPEGRSAAPVWSLSGEHNRANACAALLAARHVGVPLDRGWMHCRASSTSNGAWKCAAKCAA
jgi:UDP-N-acetylmuramate: L-alanyl-gamma-D-glutamyl-meso-diaminopimelate ligase